MSDENTGGVAPAENANPTNPTGDEGVQNPNSSEAGEGRATDASEGDEGGKDNAEGAEDTFEDDGAEPEVAKRKTAKDFIIERQQRKIAKMQRQNGGSEYDDDDEGDDDPAYAPSGKPDGDDPQDGGNDAQVEAMRPIIEQHLADQDAQEVTAFLEEYPDLAPYAGKVERLMKHPSRRQIPVRSIFFEVAGEHLMRIGAERARKADAEAKGTRAGGDSNRDGLAPKDWSTASKEELEAEQQRVRQQARY